MHLDPPVNPDLFGWGDRSKNGYQNLLIEESGIQGLECVVQAQTAKAATQLSPEIEAQIRRHFKFDEGWNFMVAERIVLGLSEDDTIMISQNIGNCVGNSHACLYVARNCDEILAEGQPEEPLGSGNLAVPFIPFTYGVGRLVGGLINSRGDGSFCSAQIQASQKYGYLPCYTPGLERYPGTPPQCDAKTGRLFGSSKTELEKWMPYAVEFDLLEAPVCKTVDDAWSLVAIKRIPLQICSNQGFAYDRFDAKYGVHLYKASGSWAHSMQIVCAFIIKGQMFFVIRNQWGKNQHKGSPEIGIPGGCMVITAEVMSRWLRSAQCIGVGEIKGLATPRNI